MVKISQYTNANAAIQLAELLVYYYALAYEWLEVEVFYKMAVVSHFFEVSEKDLELLLYNSICLIIIFIKTIIIKLVVFDTWLRVLKQKKSN